MKTLDAGTLDLSKRPKKAWHYFLLTLGWSFACWGAAIYTRLPQETLSVTLLLAAGGLGPPLAAIYLIVKEKDPHLSRDYWRRIMDVRRIRPAWYLVIFLTVPATTMLAAITQQWIDPASYSPAQFPGLLSQPLDLLSLAFITFFFGPLPEEMGWRGYALDQLQSRWNALVSSLILGVVWAFWHVPLFFIEGTYQQQIGFASPEFWSYMAGIFPTTLLMTWIYNNTDRSTLSAILFHFMVNFTGQWIGPAQALDAYRLFWQAMLALAVALIYGPHLIKTSHTLKRPTNTHDQSQGKLS